MVSCTVLSLLSSPMTYRTTDNNQTITTTLTSTSSTKQRRYDPINNKNCYNALPSTQAMASLTNFTDQTATTIAGVIVVAVAVHVVGVYRFKATFGILPGSTAYTTLTSQTWAANTIHSLLPTRA